MNTKEIVEDYLRRNKLVVKNILKNSTIDRDTLAEIMEKIFEKLKVTPERIEFSKELQDRFIRFKYKNTEWGMRLMYFPEDKELYDDYGYIELSSYYDKEETTNGFSITAVLCGNNLGYASVSDYTSLYNSTAARFLTVLEDVMELI